jgi:hypothetical protein
MLKILSAVLLVAATYAAPADAHGGGPAESIPGTNYTEMPDFRPYPRFTPHIKAVRSHVRQNPVRGN